MKLQASCGPKTTVFFRQDGKNKVIIVIGCFLPQGFWRENVSFQRLGESFHYHKANIVAHKVNDFTVRCDLSYHQTEWCIELET